MRILITVKTYPVLSKTYIELVCTAGLRENGDWVRLYPIPFRTYSKIYQFKKFDWIECDVVRNIKDNRIESYKPTDVQNIRRIGHIGAENGWRERNGVVLEKTTVYEDTSQLISHAKDERTSLAVFRPKEFIGFSIKASSITEKDIQKLNLIENKILEKDLFEENDWRENLKLAKALPFEFRYEFVDKKGKRSNMRILDWEIGALFWKVSGYNPEKYEEAKEAVRRQYEDNFLSNKDLYLFLGTTSEYHDRSLNPFTIVGVYYPPKLSKSEDRSLFDDL